MPVKVVKRGDKFRVIESETGRIAKNSSGSAIDGGGFKSKTRAGSQARAVNASLSKRGKI
jgi:hypothetical protein